MHFLFRRARVEVVGPMHNTIVVSDVTPRHYLEVPVTHILRCLVHVDNTKALTAAVPMVQAIVDGFAATGQIPTASVSATSKEPGYNLTISFEDGYSLKFEQTHEAAVSVT